VGVAPVGQRAANLPWLCPGGAALLTLADESPLSAFLAADPGAVLLVLRYSRPTPQPADFQLSPAAFRESIVPEAAARFLEGSPAAGRLDGGNESTRALLRFARRAARTAGEIARRTRLCPPAAASAAALLSPTGWLLVAAEDPTAVDRCRNGIAEGEPVAATQAAEWGLTHDAIFRRTASRWRLPHWLCAVVGSLGLPPEIAAKLGADERLFSVVNAAVAACEASGQRLGLAVPPGISEELAREAGKAIPAEPDDEPEPDLETLLVVRLLKAAARACRAEAANRLADAHASIDRLHAELRELEGRFETRVRDARLSGLAELAAGAGHEINNPLAVILGNAQHLLARTDEPESRVALGSVVRQTRRIAEIVKDLMQFARPRAPVTRRLELGSWLPALLDAARPLAAVQGVEIHCNVVDGETLLLADPGQLGRVVSALLHNAIDAVKPEGTVRVSAGLSGTAVQIAVEDNGPDIAEDVVEHMFDPFYSGRTAGRGRGLGLPTAWRLARENGGEVRYEPGPGGPTRFVLELPALAAPVISFADRKSA
jgi:signal transduction histidine kinase